VKGLLAVTERCACSSFNKLTSVSKACYVGLFQVPERTKHQFQRNALIQTINVFCIFFSLVIKIKDLLVLRDKYHYRNATVEEEKDDDDDDATFINSKV
jgi:hypothetical protein